MGAPDGVERVLRVLRRTGEPMAPPMSVPLVPSVASGRGHVIVTAADGGIGRERGEVQVLLEQLVEGDAEARGAGVRIARDDVGELGHDGAGERITDHLHVGVRRADARVGLGPVLGGLGVDDVLGLQHVVGDEARSTASSGRPVASAMNFGEVGHVRVRSGRRPPCPASPCRLVATPVV